MRLALLILGLALLPLRGGETPPTVRALAAAILAKLGNDWTVAYRAEGPFLSIKAVKYIRVMPPGVISGSVAALPKPEGFVIFKVPSADNYRDFDLMLSIEPLVTPKKYVLLDLHNAEIGKNLRALRTELMARGILHDGKGEEFSPKTETDRRDIARYHQLGAQIARLPDFYYQDISLSWVGYDSFPDGAYGETYYKKVIDDTERSVCAEMTRKLISVLSTYPRP